MYPNQQSHNIRQQQQPNARDYYMPTEQRMPGFQEFISRYESKCLFFSVPVEIN